MITGSQDLEILRHRDYAGKPCLNIGGYARPLAPSSKVFDHVVEANNSCSQSLRVQICYYKSQQCIDMQIPGRTRKEAVLGTTGGTKDFRYEFRERF
jgi:hypothetical protein